MLSSYTVCVGFVASEPRRKDDSRGSVCVFELCVTDASGTRSVPCMATGLMCERMMAYGQRGTFWAVGGQFRDHPTKRGNLVVPCVKVMELEMLERPRIPGIGIEEFVEGYRPKEIIKRAKRILKEGK